MLLGVSSFGWPSIVCWSLHWYHNQRCSSHDALGYQQKQSRTFSVLRNLCIATFGWLSGCLVGQTVFALLICLLHHLHNFRTPVIYSLHVCYILSYTTSQLSRSYSITAWYIIVAVLPRVSSSYCTMIVTSPLSNYYLVCNCYYSSILSLHPCIIKPLDKHHQILSQQYTSMINFETTSIMLP